MAEVTTSQLLAEMKPAWRAALGDRVSHEYIAGFVRRNRVRLESELAPLAAAMNAVPEVRAVEPAPKSEARDKARSTRYAAVRAPDCRTCPHRGMPLTGQPVDTDGGVVCPAHGLRWSRKDGSLMRRTCPPDLPTAEAAKQYRDALRSGQGFEALP